jgi:hypothetical protein
MFRARRVECLYRLKKGLTAYAGIGPTADTFQQLANLYDNDKDTDGLEKLITAHANTGARDPELHYWRARVLFVRGEYGRAVLLHDKYMEAAPENAVNLWRARNELVRARLRVNPAGAAQSVAEIGPMKLNVALRAAVAAATDDRAELERLLEESIKHGGNTWFYGDEDFRRFIGAEKYRDLREKYPDPAPAPKDKG